MMYCAIIPQCHEPRYLLCVLHNDGNTETDSGFSDLDHAKAFLASEYPGAIELTEGEFVGKTITVDREVAV